MGTPLNLGGRPERASHTSMDPGIETYRDRNDRNKLNRTEKRAAKKRAKHELLQPIPVIQGWALGSRALVSISRLPVAGIWSLRGLQGVEPQEVHWHLAAKGLECTALRGGFFMKERV